MRTDVKERFSRLKAIKKIIRSYRIESQESLLEHLDKEGYSVTQATLSRDLKLLRVGKISDGWSGYYYALPGEGERQPETDESRAAEKTYAQDLLRGYVAIDFSGNLAVMKTLSGHANSVAFALDNLAVDGIVGTIAGDDTILIVLAEGVSHDDLIESLREKVPELEV
jgi:transcriptional regulator of arginine metabolism